MQLFEDLLPKTGNYEIKVFKPWLYRCLLYTSMPGHAEAALSAYPELGCFGQPVEVPQHGFTQNIFCAGKEEVLHFLKDVYKRQGTENQR